MSNGWVATLLFFVAFIVTMGAFPFVLRFARRHELVDNPNARKLQRVPVPVIGGAAVFLGVLVAMTIAITVFRFHFLAVGLVMMGIMWVIGTWDDLRDIPPMFRFIVETVLIWGMMTISETGINDLHGLWGFGEMSMYFWLPLSIVAGVGIINAINLIDGVDGYCSGFCMVAFVLYGMVLFKVGNIPTACFCLICAGALIPFFLHNVFGQKSKMFLGDGGSLMMGTGLVCVLFRMLSSGSNCSALEEKGVGLMALTLAVMCIPVFDTLRVMSLRVIRGYSPFHPDKTHLHHLFIEMGYSHVGTSISIILINLFVVAVWYLSYRLGVSINWQFYLVVMMGLMVTFGFYGFMKRQQAYNDGEGTKLYQWFRRRGAKTHIERDGFWLWMRHLVDVTLNLKDKDNDAR